MKRINPETLIPQWIEKYPFLEKFSYTGKNGLVYWSSEKINQYVGYTLIKHGSKIEIEAFERLFKEIKKKDGVGPG